MPEDKQVTKVAAEPPTKSVSLRVVDDYSSYMAGHGQNPPTIEGDNNIFDPFEALYKFYNKMPELRGIATGIVEDIMGEGFDLEGPEAKVKKVKKFLRRNRFTRKLHAALLDYVITGNGYMGKAAVSQRQVSETIQEVYKRHMNKSAVRTDIQFYTVLSKLAYPDLFASKTLYNLKSRNMRIDYDAHGEVKGYIQRIFTRNSEVTMGVSGQNPETGTKGIRTGASGEIEIRFRPEEIIHFAYEPVGDDIYGTSPFAPAIFDIAGLFYAKNYGTVFFQNDATPSRLYIMEDTTPESDDYKRFTNELKQHRQKPHKNMVATGRVEVVQIGSNNKDLEFGDYIDKFLRQICMASATNFKYGSFWGKKTTTPESMEPYYKKINLLQKEVEDDLNVFLFDEFGVEIKFKRTYKRDESREADIVNKLTGKAVLTIDEGREYLGHKPATPEQMKELQDSPSPESPKSDVEAVDSRREQNEDEPTGPGNPKER